mgnify:CR=1 FL=1
MRLLGVELTRFRSRRAIVLMLVGAALITAFIAGSTLWDTRPVSDADRAAAEKMAAHEAGRRTADRRGLLVFSRLPGGISAIEARSPSVKFGLQGEEFPADRPANDIDFVFFCALPPYQADLAGREPGPGVVVPGVAAQRQSGHVLIVGVAEGDDGDRQELGYLGGAVREPGVVTEGRGP